MPTRQTIAFCLLLVAWAGNAKAAVTFPNPDDFRIVDGHTINISTNSDWGDISEYGHFEFQGLVRRTNIVIAIRFEVVSHRDGNNSSSLSRVGQWQGLPPTYTHSKDYKERVAIFNCQKTFLTDEEITKLKVRRVGQYDRFGDVIAAYDCGILDPDRFTIAAGQSNQITAKIKAAWDAVAEKKRQEQLAAVPRIVAFQFSRASNGYGSFQIEIAKRYLRGDGVETNRDLALHWLNAACTNGESEATNILRRLKSVGHSMSDQ